METPAVIELTYRALQLSIILLMPAMVVSVVTGLLIAFLEAITQIQDQSIGTSVKIIAVLVTLMVTASWTGSNMLQFGQMLFNLIGTIRVAAPGS